MFNHSAHGSKVSFSVLGLINGQRRFQSQNGKKQIENGGSKYSSYKSLARKEEIKGK